MQLNIKTEHGELRLQPYANTVVHSPHSCLYFFHAYHRNIASSIIFAQCTGFIGVDHIFAQSSAQLEGNRGFDIDVFQSGDLFRLYESMSWCRPTFNGWKTIDVL